MIVDVSGFAPDLYAHCVTELLLIVGDFGGDEFWTFRGNYSSGLDIVIFGMFCPSSLCPNTSNPGSLRFWLAANCGVKERSSRNSLYSESFWIFIVWGCLRRLRVKFFKKDEGFAC